ncbi:hypothetical protein Sste5346_001368 [Sporothrix stenoceras]|uniref:F-box domain-containing protein n=1 Tax=Sporothrix stenoceras TaxID=5173 RepID=A0ABR3ZNW5_9PEZI
MVQRRLEFYSQQPPQARQDEAARRTPSVSFLDLPYNVRHRIYTLVDLVRFCPININQEGLRAEALRTGAKKRTGYSCFYTARRFLGRDFGNETVPSCECPALPVALLYVSRSISDEVCHILYSENAFTISRSDLWGLSPLRNMGKRNAASLRRLTIRLNNSQCTFDFKIEAAFDMPPCHPLCQSHGIHDALLSNQTRQGGVVIQEWQDLCRTWGVHLEPGQLRLDFVCDTKDRATAEQISNTLTMLPQLQECSVRLGCKPHWDTRMLSLRTTRRLQEAPFKCSNDRSIGKRAYSYYLPTEILTRILEYSDLIAPYDLEWRPDGGFAPYDCCKSCTSTLDCCTCSKYYATHSTTCKCWLPPTALFLVNRQVHDAAMTIFYGRNRFVALPPGGRMNGNGYFISKTRKLLKDSEDPPLAQFLARIPQRAHALIRYLILVMPSTVPWYRRPAVEEDGGRVWVITKELVKQRLDLQQLQLSMYSETIFYIHSDDLSPCWADYAVAYSRMLGDLSVWRGLRDFFLYLQYPHPYRVRSFDKVAIPFEKALMGDDYNSIERGKWDEPLRLWYNGQSREGTVYGPNGTRVWPFFDEDPERSPPPPLAFEYA